MKPAKRIQIPEVYGDVAEGLCPVPMPNPDGVARCHSELSCNPRTRLAVGSIIDKSVNLRRLLMKSVGTIIVTILGCVAFGMAAPIHDHVTEGDHSAVKSTLEIDSTLINSLNENHETPLLLAATHGHIDIARYLLEHNADFSIGDADDSRPIHLAAIGGHTTIIELLISLGDDINVADNNGMTPLLFSLSSRKGATVDWLIENGADIDKANNRQVTPIHYAAARGQHEALVKMIERGGDIAARTGDNTALNFAIMMEDSIAIRILVENGAPLEVADDYQRTPLLLIARESGNTKLARLLVAHGANVNAVDRYGDTPLSLAAWRGFETMVDYFLDVGAELPTTKEKRQELLSDAAEHGLSRFFMELIETDVDLDKTVESGGSLLHYAAAGGSEQIVSMLIERGHDVNGLDRYGRSPLHYAAERGRAATAQVLVARGADINARSLAGYSAYNVAVDFERQDVRNWLIENDADTSSVQFPELSGPYFGQSLPGDEPELFALDIVSSNQFEHGCVSFTPDGQEAFWTQSRMLSDSVYTTAYIMSSRIESGHWTTPQLAAFSAIGQSDDIPMVSPDGSRLLYLSRRGPNGMWYLDKEANGWSEPKYIEGGPNEQSPYWGFSVATNGTVYFGSGGDVWRSEFDGDQYSSPTKLDFISTPFAESQPLIDPDESFLIYGTHQYPDSLGGDAFRICFKDDSGGWTKPVKLICDGEALNGRCPALSPDGKYLFYNSQETGVTDIYWVKADFIESLRPPGTSP
jgi:ankyrin repeat protein